MSKFRIIKTDAGTVPMRREYLEQLHGLHSHVEEIPCPTESDLIEKARGAAALVLMIEPATRLVLEQLPDLRIIARVGVGVDSIDLEAATELGIQVTNVPDANFDEVATHAMALILDQVRRIHRFDDSLRAARWEPLEIGRELRRASDLRIGIIGFGRSARRLVQLLAPLNATLLVSAREHHRESVMRAGTQMVELDELVACSDIFSLHVPLTSETEKLINAGRLASMKPGASLINVSRGGLVDETALAAAVKEGRLSGAGLDVFDSEPLPAESPLRGLPGITLTPHVAYLSQQSALEAGRSAFAEVGRHLRGEDVLNPANSPRSTA